MPFMTKTRVLNKYTKWGFTIRLRILNIFSLYYVIGCFDNVCVCIYIYIIIIIIFRNLNRNYKKYIIDIESKNY